MNPWLELAGAIIAEVIATSALKASEHLTRPKWAAVVVIGYAVAFFLLSRTVQTVPIGIAYAIWAGVGIVLVTAIAWVAYGQTLDAAALIGLALIIAGVTVIHLFSSAGH